MIRAVEIRELYRDLYRIPPMVLLIVGLVLVGGGAAVAVWGWHRGILFRAHAVLCIGGIALLLLSLSNKRKRADVERQIDILQARGKEIVAKVTELRKGGAPMKFLIEQGLTDVRIQSYVLSQAG